MNLKLELVDQLMQQGGELDEALKELGAKAETEIAPWRGKWDQILSPLREQRAAVDRTILALLKQARQEFFAAADLVDLRHGFLLYGKRRVVRKARGVLALLESLQWEEAIRRTAKVRWEVLADWPEARLIACGTERMDQETFAYEIKTPGQIYRDVARRGMANLLGGGEAA